MIIRFSRYISVLIIRGNCSFALKRNNQVSVLRAGSGDWKMSRTPSASLLAPPRGNSTKSYEASYVIQSQSSVIAAVSYKAGPTS